MANNFNNQWQGNTWDVGGEEYKKSAVGTEWLPKDAAYFTGINPNTGESVYNSNNDKELANDPIAQKLNSFASTFRNILARMYRKSTYTGNKQEDIDNRIPLKEVKEFMHHFIKMKNGNYREFVEEGEYYDSDKRISIPQVIIMANSIDIIIINQSFVKRGEKYEIEVHTHPTLDPLINNYEKSRNIAFSPTDIALMPKINDFISFVEAETMQFALVIIDRRRAERNFSKSKLSSISTAYDLIYKNPNEEESYSEASIRAVKSVLGQANENGIAFYVNDNKSNPDFILQN